MTYEPVEGIYLGHDIRTNHAPGGGPSIIEMLNILEDDDLVAMGHNSEDYVYTVARAQIAAMIDRAPQVLDDIEVLITLQPSTPSYRGESRQPGRNGMN